MEIHSSVGSKKKVKRRGTSQAPVSRARPTSAVGGRARPKSAGGNSGMGGKRTVYVPSDEGGRPPTRPASAFVSRSFKSIPTSTASASSGRKSVGKKSTRSRALSSSAGGRSGEANRAVVELEKHARIASIYLDNFPDRDSVPGAAGGGSKGNARGKKGPRFSRDPESMDLEIQNLKKDMAKLEKDRIALSTKSHRLEAEVQRKDRQLEEILRAKSFMDAGGRVYDQRRQEASIVKALKSKVKTLEGVVKGKDEELSRIKADSKFTRMAELELELKTYYYETRRLQGLLEAQEGSGVSSAEVEGLQEEVEVLREREDKFKAALRTLKEDKGKLLDELEEAHEEHDALELESKAAAARAEEESEELQEELDEAKSELAEAKGQLEALKTQLESKITEAAGASEQAEQAKALVEKNAELAGDLARVKEELEQASRELEEAEAVTKTAQEAETAAKKDLANSMTRLTALEDELAAVKVEKAELEAEMDSLKVSMSKTQSEAEAAAAAAKAEAEREAELKRQEEADRAEEAAALEALSKTDADKEAAAALKIQSTFRGHQGRKEAERLAKEQKDIEIAQAEREAALTRDMEEREEAAAVRIQSAFRGHKVRQNTPKRGSKPISESTDIPADASGSDAVLDAVSKDQVKEDDEDEVPDGPREVRVRVIQAESLVSADLGGSSDPYAVVWIKNTSKELLRDKESKDVKKTQVIKSSLAPMWNESFTLHVENPAVAELCINIMDWDRFGSHDSLGSWTVPLCKSSMWKTEGKGIGRWFDVSDAKSGKLYLEISWVLTEDEKLARLSKADSSAQSMFSAVGALPAVESLPPLGALPPLGSAPPPSSSSALPSVSSGGKPASGAALPDLGPVPTSSPSTSAAPATPATPITESPAPAPSPLAVSTPVSTSSPAPAPSPVVTGLESEVDDVEDIVGPVGDGDESDEFDF